MGRGHRGGSGRRSGGGGGGGRSSRPQQAPAPPTGEALRVELRAAPGFYKALSGQECPVPAAEGSSSSSPSPLGTSVLQMGEWKDLGGLIGWFRDGISGDSTAELAFSTKLTKQQRASVHGTATAVGLGGLGTSSRGVGEQRCVVVLAKQRAQRPELSEKQDHQAFWTWKWAGKQGIQVSRDEVAEMMLGEGLTPELQAIWDKGASQQKAVQQLCAAIESGDAAAAAAVLDQQPSLLSEGVFDVQTGVAPLHLAAQQGRVELLELLLSRGAPLEALDGHGWTALHVARKFEQSDAEGVLLRAGAHDPDAGKSILEKKVALPADKPTSPTKPAAAAAGAAATAAAAAAQQPEAAPAAAAAAAAERAEEAAAVNGISQPAAAAATAPSAPAAAAGASSALSDSGSQDVYVDSVASVCGTERTDLAAEVGSNAEDYLDPQYQAASSTAFSPPLPVEEEEEGEAGEAEKSAADVAGPGKPAEPAEEEPAESAESARAQAEAVALAAVAAAEAAAAAEEAEEEEAAAAAEAIESAAAAATRTARDAFNAAVAAAEAAEAAAEAAEAMPGAEAAQRAAAFRLESQAAVAAAAAAAVVAGDTLDDVLSPAVSLTLTPGGVAVAEVGPGAGVSLPLPLPVAQDGPQPPASSVVSVCGSDTAPSSQLLPEESAATALGSSEFGSAVLSSAGSAPPAGQSPAPSVKADAEQEQEEAEPSAEAAAQHAAADAADAVAASGTAAPAVAAAAAAPAAAAAAPQPPKAAAAASAADLNAAAVAAAEHTATAARGAVAAASKSASQAREELAAGVPDWGTWLEQRAPEWKRWAQEHPGSVMAGAGLVAAGLAALLLARRW